MRAGGADIATEFGSIWNVVRSWACCRTDKRQHWSRGFASTPVSKYVICGAPAPTPRVSAKGRRTRFDSLIVESGIYFANSIDEVITMESGNISRLSGWCRPGAPSRNGRHHHRPRHSGSAAPTNPMRHDMGLIIGRHPTPAERPAVYGGGPVPSVVGSITPPPILMGQ
jgi:hypothetical protein